MSVVRNADARRSETPSGVMTTLASPTVGGAERSLWRVEAKGGVSGPPHVIDVEQVWTWLDGTATVELPAGAVTVEPGDTVIIPGGELRRVVAGPDGYTAVVTASAAARATTPDGTDHGTPAWIA
ncbi:cupin [Nonomuraea sp. NBC_01738]|uniref:cupin domain-containing protein n=1 Tax=Nonomuraea sp. NBC_01738 TaxID=2976003 RepID=UPI002E0F7D17|nr:cupin [Nonomuraea sp. NBC_01738]